MRFDKTNVTRSGAWWAVEDSNLRPPRCQRVSALQAIDLYDTILAKTCQFRVKLRKTTQKNIHTLRRFNFYMRSNSGLCNTY